MAIKKAIILTIFEVSRFMTFDTIFSIFCPQCTKLSLSHYLSLISNTFLGYWLALEMSNFRSRTKRVYDGPYLAFSSLFKTLAMYVVARVYHTL